MDEITNLLEQKEELIARVLKLHVRWDVADLDTYTEAIDQLQAIATIADDLTNSLHERLWEREEAGRN